MKLEVLMETWDFFGGHDLLSLIPEFLELEDQDFGSAVQSLEINVRFRPQSHLEQVYDRENDRMLENPDYKRQRAKKHIFIGYVSKISLQEIEAIQGNLDAEMFRRLVFEIRDCLAGIRPLLQKSTDFDMEKFLSYLDKRLSLFPLNETCLEELHRKEKERSRSISYDDELSSTRDSLDEVWESLCEDPDAEVFPVEDVCWRLGEKVYDDFDEFVKALHMYSWEITDVDGLIQDSKVCEGTQFYLAFNGIKNGDKQVSEIDLLITDDGSESIGYLRFMFLVNNHTCKFLERSDHIYYEGFFEGEPKKGIPVFELMQGS